MAIGRTALRPLGRAEITDTIRTWQFELPRWIYQAYAV